MRRRRNVEAFSLSFLDCICCGFGAIILLLVLSKIYEPVIIEKTQDDLESLIALLQQEGVINDLLVGIGFLTEDNRLAMIHNQTGTIIAMVHVLLPFMVLPLYSVMKTIPPTYMRAARSLGANPFTAFVRVYMPGTVPGVGAGSILVVTYKPRL